uniref:Ovule protein n=1 Tax=Haemonchus placei TaxID=6290 RepID=A0A158QPT8_HAEPC
LRSEPELIRHRIKKPTNDSRQTSSYIDQLVPSKNTCYSVKVSLQLTTLYRSRSTSSTAEGSPHKMS